MFEICEIITNNLQLGSVFMLIRFAVENFLSFKDKQVFSMVAAKHTRHPDHVADIAGKRILKGSFIFGANASGKSNFVKAISSARNMVFKGVAGVERKYFRLDPAWAEKPGMFQFDIFSNGSFYSYGFAFTYLDASIISEWLYKIHGNSEICVFEREYKDGKTNINTELKFSEDNRFRFRIYSEDIKKSKTFLREIAEKETINNPEFKAIKDVWKWFQELVVLFPNTHLGPDAFTNLASDKQFHSILQSLDTGIKSFSIEEQPIDKILNYAPEQVRDNFFASVENFVKKKGRHGTNVILGDDLYSFVMRNNQLVALKQMMNHGNPSELFSYNDESDGTRRLFDLLPFVTNITGSGVILIDEIDRSFHTKLIIRYLELFYANTTKLDIQLIASLHDVNIMDLDIVRQDEIWFIYKESETGASRMYSLNKFQIRFDKKIIKDYLLGRFGAIPCFEQLEDDYE